MAAETPRHDDGATTASPTTSGQQQQLLCPVCWTRFTRVGHQRYCTDGCRKTAWTRRHATPATAAEPVVPKGIRRRDVTIYECPTCNTRYHGEQWCHDCNQPCTRSASADCAPTATNPSRYPTSSTLSQPATSANLQHHQGGDFR